MLTIRRFEPADLPSSASVFATVFSSPPWNEHWATAVIERRLLEIAVTPGFFGLVAADDSGAVLGFLMGYCEQWSDGRHFYVKEICVCPEHQRTGIGSALMREAERQLCNEGVARIYLLTARGGFAEAFYAKCGFYVSPKMLVMARRLE